MKPAFTKLPCSRCHQKHMRPVGANCVEAKRRDKFATIKSLEKMIADGDLCNILRAAELTGYSPQHLRRLCDAKAIAHHRRRDEQYYFSPEQIEALKPQPVNPVKE